MARRPAAALAAAMVLFAACGSELARSGAERTAAPQETAKVGSQVLDDLAAGEGAGGEGDAPGASGDGDVPAARSAGPAFVLIMVDQNGGNPANIPVEVDGSFGKRTMFSDAKGRVTVAGDPGFYTFKVPVGCRDTLQVQGGGSGRFGIAEGQGGEAEVEVIWRQRIGPRGPVFSSKGPYWPVGDTIRLRYDVVDRCDDDVHAPGREFGSYRFEPGKNVKVVGAPSMRADKDGFAWVEISCTADGATSLVLKDSKNASDAFDLVEADTSSARRPTCGSA